MTELVPFIATGAPAANMLEGINRSHINVLVIQSSKTSFDFLALFLIEGLIETIVLEERLPSKHETAC
jgi:hypothetical protein